jgi:hypothetical protein
MPPLLIGNECRFCHVGDHILAGMLALYTVSP